MRISDWSSDVCSSDLVDEARIVIIAGSGAEGDMIGDDRYVEDDVGLIAEIAAVRLGIEAAMPLGLEPARRRPVGDVADRAGERPETIESALRTEQRFHPFEIEKRSEEHTSELQSLMRISYAVFCLKK